MPSKAPFSSRDPKLSTGLQAERRGERASEEDVFLYYLIVPHNIITYRPN